MLRFFDDIVRLKSIVFLSFFFFRFAFKDNPLKDREGNLFFSVSIRIFLLNLKIRDFNLL